jgi:hypothetical protein
MRGELSNVRSSVTSMKKAIFFAAVTFAGICFLGAAYFCHFYYFRYKGDMAARVEGDLNNFEMRLSRLEAHKARELVPVSIMGQISTTDRPPDTLFASTASENGSDSFVAVIDAKAPRIVPELRLSSDSTTNQEYAIQVKGQFDAVASAWFTHAESLQDLAAFEEFRVYALNETNVVRIIARPKPGASVQMRFYIVALCVRSR